jgi:mono/diheme cytochrome c family protein
MRIEIKAAILAVATSAFVLGLIFGFAPVLRSSPAADANKKPQSDSNPTQPAVNLGEQAKQGHSLFARNCAHCHGDDARGDEGPTLYNLAMSDARIAKRIKEGVKGEMPKFGSKLNDADIAALTTFLRTLKD